MAANYKKRLGTTAVGTGLVLLLLLLALPGAATPPLCAAQGCQPDEWDRAASNYDCDHATLVAPGQTLPGLNLYPAGDNDFFRWKVDSLARCFTAETLDLVTGNDTNILLYERNASGNWRVVVGSDDAGDGTYRSRASWCPTRPGEMCVAIGFVGNQPPDACRTGYSFRLSQYNRPQPPPPTEVPPTETPTPVPTPEPGVTPSPMPTETPRPTLTPLPQTVVDVVIYVDENDNGRAEPAEGVANISIRLVDPRTNESVFAIKTDNLGHARFSVMSTYPMTLMVYYIGGFSVPIDPYNPPLGPVQLRVLPLSLPGFIP